LPAALAAIAAYKASVINGADFDDEKHPLLTLVGKKEIAENGDFNLSGERYKVQISKDSKYEYVRIGDVFETSSGGTPLKSNENYWRNGTIPWLKSGEVSQGFIYTSEDFISEEGLKNSSAKIFPADSVLVAMYGATAGQVGLLKFESTTNQAVCAILPNKRVVPEYLYYLLKYRTEYLVSLSVGGAQPNISQKIIKDLEIPLPPTAVQAEIVAEIESYQKIIDGARQVVENYRPRIPINPDWPLVEIESVAADEKYSIKAGPFGSSLKKEFYVEKGYKIYGQEQVIRGDASYGDYYIDEDKFNELRSCAVQKDDVLISLVGTYGKTLIIPENFEPGIINPRLMKISLNQRIINPKFFVLAFNSDAVMNQVHGMSYGGTMNILNVTILKALKLPLPDIDIQKQIVNEIEEEQALVQANRQLITRFEQKIKDRIARVWGEA
jgi:restriction endonuclease S subunit